MERYGDKMLTRFIECGQIVSTQGLKGEVRVNPWCDDIDFLKQFDRFYIDENGNRSLTVVAVRAAGNVAVVKFQGIDTPEQARELRNTVLYIDRESTDLGNRHFIKDLVGCTVYDAESGATLGVLSNVLQLPANDVWEIKKDGKTYLLPAIDSVIGEIVPEENRLTVKPMKGIFDDED